MAGRRGTVQPDPEARPGRQPEAAVGGVDRRGALDELAHPGVGAVRGCVAAERGPLVYCAESVDQDPAARLDEVAVDTSVPPADQGMDGGLGGAVTLGCTARALQVGEPGRATVVTPLTMVPYHLWGNRGPASMRVWLPALPEPAG